MISESAKILYRVIPEQFRGPGFAVRGNIIFKTDANGDLLPGAVGQLEDATELDVPRKKVLRLFGGEAALTQLSQLGHISSIVGAVASVINLGVSVAGFMHVSRSLKQIERRLANVEQSLERVEGLLGVVDQKVNQLLNLNELQLHALSDIGELIKSYKTAEVHGALEILQFRLQNSDTPDSNGDARVAIKTLQDYRKWLSGQRSDANVSLPVRSELLRAEVLVTMAESRARCFVGDEAYAAWYLEQFLGNVREEVREAWSSVIEAHGMHSLCLYDDLGDEDWLDVYSWLYCKNLRDTANYFLNKMAIEWADDKFKLEMRIVEIKLEKPSFLMKVQAELANAWLNEATKDGVVDRVQKVIDSQDSELAGEEESSEKDSEAADIASLVLLYRLAHDVEAALAFCAATEAAGGPVRDLLLAKEEPGSPAIVLEMREPTEGG